MVACCCVTPGAVAAPARPRCSGTDRAGGLETGPQRWPVAYLPAGIPSASRRSRVWGRCCPWSDAERRSAANRPTARGGKRDAVSRAMGGFTHPASKPRPHVNGAVQSRKTWSGAYEVRAKGLIRTPVGVRI
jgi:hypothetical protein